MRYRYIFKTYLTGYCRGFTRLTCFFCSLSATGSWNIDASRSARETLPDYAQLSYYQIWLAAMEKLMAERGQVLDVGPQPPVDAVKRERAAHLPHRVEHPRPLARRPPDIVVRIIQTM